MTVDVARERFALVVTLLGLASFLAAVSGAPTESVVALAALAAATAVVARRPLVLPSAAPGVLQPLPRTAAVPLVLTGRCTDTVRHPVRPRAPGRA